MISTLFTKHCTTGDVLPLDFKLTTETCTELSEIGSNLTTNGSIMFTERKTYISRKCGELVKRGELVVLAGVALLVEYESLVCGLTLHVLLSTWKKKSIESVV